MTEECEGSGRPAEPLRGMVGDVVYGTCPRCHTDRPTRGGLLAAHPRLIVHRWEYGPGGQLIPQGSEPEIPIVVPETSLWARLMASIRAAWHSWQHPIR